MLLSCTFVIHATFICPNILRIYSSEKQLAFSNGLLGFFFGILLCFCNGGGCVGAGRRVLG